ncbi:hypothetical protein [Tenacibaculum ovolyticum]|uniref:hypothetical protein n=1 Tax=Tenacibaculum ovolyticum TaxID=104270 RepID=UPI001F1A2365|nr:hypothetical protein [Tenacibaculum ovolyticum]
MNSIFFISKPLELLGAIEARNQFKIKDSVLVIKVSKSDEPTINYLIEKSGNWNTIIRTKRKSSYGLSWLKLILKLKKKEYDYLFTRAFPIASYFVNNLNYNHLYLLDDGNATINIAKEFRDCNNLTKRFSLFKGKNKKGIKYDFVKYIYGFYGIKTEKPVNEIGFYTFYDLPNYPSQIIIENELNWFKSLKVNAIPQSSNEVYIIGTDIVGAGIVNLKDYLITLKKIAGLYKEKKLIYIPHGRESNAEIEEIKQYVNCKIRRNEFNIELDFILRNEYPVHVVGTITTALITLKLIYKKDIRVEYFNFDESKVIKDKRKDIHEIYEYQKKYIDFIQLNY